MKAIFKFNLQIKYEIQNTKFIRLSWWQSLQMG
jgi:hypothetical protein